MNMHTGLPTGVVTLVFADVPEYSLLTDELDAHDSALCIQLYMAALRRNLKKFGGYEVAADISNMTFFATFSIVAAALQWATAVHEDLLDLDWPPALLHHPKLGPPPVGGLTESWRGIRCRIAMHVGKPTLSQSASGRPEYSGSPVTTATQALEIAPLGGTLLTAPAYRSVSPEWQLDVSFVSFDNTEGAFVVNSPRLLPPGAVRGPVAPEVDATPGIAELRRTLEEFHEVARHAPSDQKARSKKHHGNASQQKTQTAASSVLFPVRAHDASPHSKRTAEKSKLPQVSRGVTFGEKEEAPSSEVVDGNDLAIISARLVAEKMAHAQAKAEILQLQKRWHSERMDWERERQELQSRQAPDATLRYITNFATPFIALLERIHREHGSDQKIYRECESYQEAMGSYFRDLPAQSSGRAELYEFHTSLLSLYSSYGIVTPDQPSPIEPTAPTLQSKIAANSEEDLPQLCIATESSAEPIEVEWPSSITEPFRFRYLERTREHGLTSTQPGPPRKSVTVLNPAEVEMERRKSELLALLTRIPPTPPQAPTSRLPDLPIEATNRRSSIRRSIALQRPVR